MVTGDSIEAAIAVAKKCNILVFPTKNKNQKREIDNKVAILDVEGNNNNQKKNLKWTYYYLDNNNNNQKSSNTKSSRTMTTDRILSSGIPLVATGSAVEYVVSSKQRDETNNNKHGKDELKLIHRNWHKFQIFARASPHQKVLVASGFKRIGKKILMCGDGVNDVAAMKVADCGVALLNGFGDHSATTVLGDNNRVIDIENERRLRQLNKRSIGSNRRQKKKQNNNRKDIVKEKLNQALQRTKMNAAKHQGTKNTTNPESVELTFSEHMSTIVKVMGEERKRTAVLQKGGSGAAKILAQEDKQIVMNEEEETGMNKKSNKNRNDNTITDNEDEKYYNDDIKLGEASLVSSFSCLRPAIDGIESMLRYSIASTAHMQAMYHKVAQSGITSALTYLVLFGQQYSYGKHMGFVELILFMLQSEMCNLASCTPRPKLPVVVSSNQKTTKVLPESCINLRSILSVTAQSILHVLTLNMGISVAKDLETKYKEPDPRQRLIQVAEDGRNTLLLLSSKTTSSSSQQQQQKPIMHLLRDALVEAPVLLPEDKENSQIPAIVRMFQRKPFRPNYITNIHFLHSVWTMGTNLLVNHVGYPYCGRVLEHRTLIVAIGLPLFLTAILLMEGIPKVNTLLELRLLSTTATDGSSSDTTQLKSQLRLLMILAIDLFGCYITTFLCKLKQEQQQDDTNTIFNNLLKSSRIHQEEEIVKKDDDNDDDDDNTTTTTDAAEEEEKLLKEESDENASLVRIMMSSMGMIFLHSTAKTLESQQ